MDDRTQLKALADNMEAQIVQVVKDSTPKNLSEISRLSADAVFQQYEAAARAAEEMEQDAHSRIAGIEQSIEELRQATREQLAKVEDIITAEVSEAARVIRDNGKRAQALVEEVGVISRNIRESCIDFKRRVGG